MPAPRCRVPRAHVDPITSPDLALAVFRATMSKPPVAETLVMFLDARNCGSLVVVVDGTSDPWSVTQVAETMSLAAAEIPVPKLVMATVRPGGGMLEGDDERWLGAAAAAEAQGVTLVDWFVIGTRGAQSASALVPIPSRWERAA